MLDKDYNFYWKVEALSKAMCTFFWPQDLRLNRRCLIAGNQLSDVRSRDPTDQSEVFKATVVITVAVES